MMNKKKRILELLESIGISGYEAKAFLALAELKEATAMTIASRAGIPQPRIYEILESLLKKGLIEVKIGRPRTYRILPPDMTLDLYSERIINTIRSNISELIMELKNIYSMRNMREKKPFVWISYNFDSTLLKAKKLINDIKYDAFISASLPVLEKIENTIAKKLEKNTESTIMITIIGANNRKIPQKIPQIDRVEIRRLPTGIFQFIEKDLNEALIIGEKYSIHTQEKELVLIVNETFYFACWRLAEVVKPLIIRRNNIYITKHHWVAVDISERALKQGFNIKAEIYGCLTTTRKPIVLRGYIKRAIKTFGNHIRSLVIETHSGDIKVGGVGALVKEVEAYLIKLYIE